MFISQSEFLFVLSQSPPDWTEILSHFRGSELQNYFTKILEDDLKALIKPQYVDQIPKAVKGTVQQLMDKKSERDNQDEICELLGGSDDRSTVSRLHIVYNQLVQIMFTNSFQFNILTHYGYRLILINSK